MGVLGQRAVIRLQVGWVSAVGQRQQNQDCVLVGGMLSVGDVMLDTTLEVDAGRPVLLAVLDGLGGHAAGGVASRVAAGILAGPPVPRDEESLDARVRQAHRTVTGLGRTLDGMAGMATTVAGFVVSPDAYHVFHLGDSAVFRWSEGSVGRLTAAHRVPAGGPGGGALTRCIGAGEEEAPTVDSFPLRRAVRLLACSDGVCDSVSLDDLRGVLGEGTPGDAARGLVQLAWGSGSTDNMTALVADVIP